MAVFDLLKRFVAAPANSERRESERVRASLGARVLVVDDSATIRAVLGKMLLQDGYQVLKAADGESAIEMAHTELPDLIFLDIVLPSMSGFAVLRALRRDGRTHTTPIVMMSGNQQATEQFYVQRFGADGFVKKPFGRADVFHAIRSLVQAGRLHARVEAPPVDAVPDGMTREEWNAIPEVGLPDAEHVAAATPPAAAEIPPVPQPAAESAPVAPAETSPAIEPAAAPTTLETPTVSATLSVPPAPPAIAVAAPGQPQHIWSGLAASLRMRPSIGVVPRVGGRKSESLAVHVPVPHEAPAATPVPDERKA